MPELIIDNRAVKVDDSATILDAANKLGIEIPTMCFLKEFAPSTSCIVCAVSVEGRANLVPACGAVAEDGMQVRTGSPEVLEARKTALELLLSDHLGDCMGPCQVICPARMNIPLMIRHIGAGRLREAIATMKKDIALPAVLGRICRRPCERGCRRAACDEAVSICLLKRYAADVDLQSANPFLPQCQPKWDKRVAVVGAGPAGLAAAYHLLQEGFGCTVFDDHDKPGGMLRYGVSEKLLPADVLEKEIAVIAKLGAEFCGRTRIGTALSFEELQKKYDAVFVASGTLKPDDSWPDLRMSPRGIQIDSQTYTTSLPGIFAGGDAVRERRHAVRAVADGKEAAAAIAQYLSGQEVTGFHRPFNTHIGRLEDAELKIFMESASDAPRTTPSSEGTGFTDEEARREAERCLRCDCRKAESCKLRKHAAVYNASPRRYPGERRKFLRHRQHAEVIYEPGKCIDCGLCVQVTSLAGEELGLTFIGRGFDVRVGVPFGRSLAEGLKRTARQCVAACPTGALALRGRV